MGAVKQMNYWGWAVSRKCALAAGSGGVRKPSSPHVEWIISVDVRITPHEAGILIERDTVFQGPQD